MSKEANIQWCEHECEEQDTYMACGIHHNSKVTFFGSSDREMRMGPSPILVKEKNKNKNHGSHSSPTDLKNLLNCKSLLTNFNKKWIKEKRELALDKL